MAKRNELTTGEKAIWAAAFAKCYDISGPPAEVIHDRPKWVEWESAQAHAAIEYAGGAVERARESLKSIKEGFGAKSPTYRMLSDMLR